MLLKTNNHTSLFSTEEMAGSKMLAVLLDPDKISWDSLRHVLDRIGNSPATHVFVGGSEVDTDCTDRLIGDIKTVLDLPVILFPGHPSQISEKADGILFLSLISGRNPDYLIGHHVAAAPQLKRSGMEIIPTGYILIDGGSETAVQRVTRTNPMLQDNISLIADTALAGQMLGSRMIYLEAGSGAATHVSAEVVSAVRKTIDVPLIVGGGIRSAKTIDEMYAAGADIVVIGNAFEDDLNFFNR